jgi:hypothetical protein
MAPAALNNVFEPVSDAVEGKGSSGTPLGAIARSTSRQGIQQARYNHQFEILIFDFVREYVFCDLPH